VEVTWRRVRVLFIGQKEVGSPFYRFPTELISYIARCLCPKLFECSEPKQDIELQERAAKRRKD